MGISDSFGTIGRSKTTPSSEDNTELQNLVGSPNRLKPSNSKFINAGRVAILACPYPSPPPSLGEGARECIFIFGSPSPRIGRSDFNQDRCWGMRAKGLKQHQLVLNLELLFKTSVNLLRSSLLVSKTSVDHPYCHPSQLERM